MAKHARSNQAGFLFIEAAVVFTVFLLLLMGVASYSFFVRDDAKLEAALQKAAEIISDPNLPLTYKRQNVERSYIDDAGFDQCRSGDAAEQLNCVRTAISQKRLAVSIDPKLRDRIAHGEKIFADQNIDIPLENLYPLPFSLLERPQVNGYFPVQTLPTIGIERGCFEPLNETDANIPSPLNGMYKRYYGNPYPFTEPDPALCHHVKPMYWQSPQRADFDGDRKEDLVFFKPQGHVSDWGWKEKNSGEPIPADQMDFLVYLSGAAYSQAQELRTFNLTNERDGDKPPPLPVVADYDRDGKSDYAVFEPVSGTLRIALSSRRYNLVLEANLGVEAQDPSGARGLIAIPGTFEESTKMQLAVFATGGEKDDRYQIRITDKDAIKNALASAAPYPQNVTTISTSFALADAPHLIKPNDATSSVPAFGDYDDDGITEAGWLSWYGGNLAKRVAGWVPEPNAEPLSTPARFTFPDLHRVTDDSLDLMMNPFDMELDSNGNLYFLDSVDSKLWKLKKENTPGVGGRFSTGDGHIMPGTAGTQTFAEGDFPANNVLNVSNSKSQSALSEARTNVQARSRNLKNPRKLVYAPDGAMYVSDWGNGRIVRMEAAGAGGFVGTTLTRVVLGDANCAAGNITCTNLPGSTPVTWQGGVQTASLLGGSLPGFSPVMHAAYLPGLWVMHSLLQFRFEPGVWPKVALQAPTHGESPYAKSAAPQPLPTEIPDPEFSPIPWQTPTPAPSSEGGKFKMFPMALEVIPESGNRYSLAFSSGTSVYLISPKSGENRGPIGESGETIYRIAGGGSGNNTDAAPAAFPGAPFAANRRYFNSDSGPLAQNTAICPVSDIKYNHTLNRLYAASSCSLQVAPTSTAAVDKNVGGILELLPDTNGSFITAANQLRSLAGGFWEKPCANKGSNSPGKCSGPPNSSAPGIYQRKVNIGAISSSVKTVDLINPVDLEFGPKNTLIFIDQWNDKPKNPIEPSSEDYHNNPKRTDQQHQQGIYAIELDNSGNAQQIIPISNPLSYGSGTVPVESAHWRSPYQSGQIKPQLDISAHEAPIKNIPFPATAGLALDESSGMLYASTPWLQNPNDYNCSTNPHPYCTNADNVGFIYQVKLDFDGDGQSDIDDTQIPGFIPATSDTERVKKLIGQPIQTFFKLGDGAEVNFPGGGHGSKGEYFFFNSVSECGSSEQCQTGAYYAKSTRQEAWATLLNFGDDQDFDAEDKICNSSKAGSSIDPYFGCDFTSNGPIAAPAPLHTFVGTDGYVGQNFYSNTASEADSKLYLYPVVLSSTMPKENGLKPVRSSNANSTKPVKNAKGGVVCAAPNNSFAQIPTLYKPFSDAALPHEGFSPSVFAFSTSNYLSIYTASSFSEAEDFEYLQDNDSLNYFALCTGTPGTEAVVLQIDHDDTTEKEDPNSSDQATHFPSPLLSGPRSGPENTRQFLLIDTDGDGIPNPSWLSSEAILSSATRNFASSGPLTFISTALKVPSSPKISIKTYLDAARLPFNSKSIWEDLNFSTDDANLLRPAYFGDTGASTNYSFDQARDATKETIFVGLDFEPYVLRKLTLGWEKEIGSSGYANYVEDNRYNMLAETNFPKSPGLIAAEKFLSQAMNISAEKITQDEEKFKDGSADLLLSFIAFDAEGKESVCNEKKATSLLHPEYKQERCTHLKAVSRFSKGSIWGAIKPIEGVTRYAKLSDAPHMHRTCDPSPNPPYPCPGDAQSS